MKIRGMDGPIDLYIYRPIGFLIAWILSCAGISPNTVTLCSAVLGLAAGICAFPGTASAFILCAVLFQVSNCFDCADGQLARLTGCYTKEGRILDGVSDYAVNVFVYVGALIGLLNAEHGRFPALLLVLAGGAATVLSCMYYDRAITNFACVVHGKTECEEDELESSRDLVASSRGWRRLLWRAYVFYLIAQKSQGEAGGPANSVVIPPISEEAKKAYIELNHPMLMAWSFTGPSAHVLYFLVCAVIGRIELYFLACVGVALLTCSFLLVQQVLNLKLKSKTFAKD